MILDASLLCKGGMRMGIVLRELAIRTRGHAPIHADLRTCLPRGERPLIIICHGFLVYKRWGFFPYLSERLAEAGFHVLTMSFSMNGVDEGTGLFSRPHEFARNTVSTEIEDIRRVCRFVRAQRLPAEAPVNGVWGLMGHSRGGAVAMLVAHEFEEVRSIATWSALGTLDRYTARRKAAWRRDGALVFNDGRSPGPLALDYAYYEDIDAHREAFDLPAAAASLRIPHLLVHGGRDGVATLREASHLLHVRRDGAAHLEIIPGAGHTFNARHPMHRPTPALDQAVKLTTDWFTRTLVTERKERP
jgi:pimeloyl-ACP methyl ester carboxylesterase